RPFDDLADVAVRSSVALGGKCGQELGVAFVAGGGVEQRLEEPRGRVPGAGRVEVHAEGVEDLGRVALELLPTCGRDAARRRLLPVGGLFRVEPERGHGRLLEWLTDSEHCTAAGCTRF